MINKIYEKTKNFIKENYKFMLFLIFLTILFNFKLPYFITTNGGLLNIEDKITINTKKETKGSFNLAYVNELQATLPTLLIAKLNKDWQIIKKQEMIMNNEEIKDIYIRDALSLQEANTNAIFLAYQKAHKKVTIKQNKMYVIYIDQQAKTNLKIGDQIIKINNQAIINKEELLNKIKQLNNHEKIKLEVKNENNITTKTAICFKKNDNILLGIMLANVKDIETSPNISIKFKDSESGSSGGLMMSLAIYNKLIKQDITGGRKIVGTGTIDEVGNVGSIGGVAYKLKGAVLAKADIFLVPAGKNYREAINLKNKNDYEIKIIPVKTFDEAIKVLKQ
ncbi:MAG: S16 family serine protease [Bacilli bacterium]